MENAIWYNIYVNGVLTVEYNYGTSGDIAVAQEFGSYNIQVTSVTDTFESEKSGGVNMSPALSQGGGFN